MAYIPNFTWTIADVDRALALAGRNYTVGQIAGVMKRDVQDVDRMFRDADRFVRRTPELRKVEV